MKNRWLWPGIIALAVSLLASCSEEEDVAVLNKIHLYGLDFEIDRGTLVRNTDNRLIEPKEYVFEDRFADENGEWQTVKVKGFTLGDNSRLNGNFSLSLYGANDGACVYFNMASTDTHELTPGTYVWGDEKEDFTFVASYNSKEGGGVGQISEGKVVVGKEGENYSVVFECKTKFGTTINGTYVGPLKFSHVEKMDVIQYANMKIDALLDTVKEVLEAPVFGENPYVMKGPRPDFDGGKAFFSVTGGVALTAKESIGNDKVDLALVYDKANKSVFFESPLKMGVWLGHQYDYHYVDDEIPYSGTLDFPCHTRYMFAPDGFSVDDYDAIETSSQLDFAIEGESKVEISIDADFPKFVFFEDGKGVRGVMKITQTVPFYIQSLYLGKDFEIFYGGPAYRVFYVNPSVIVGIKYASF